MYVHMDRVSLAPAAGAGDPDRGGPAADLSGLPGLLGFLTLQQVAGPVAVRLTWWDTEDGAAGLPGFPSGPHHSPAGLPGFLAGQNFEVAQTEVGPDAAQAPACAQLVYFDGPRTPEEVAAGDLAGRRRIWPAVSEISGLIGSCVLRGRDLGSLIVILATSMAALDDITQAIMATELLPGEDPALLPGPDRVEVHRVTGHRLTAAALAAATGRH